jgi:hypothetical protein
MVLAPFAPHPYPRRSPLQVAERRPRSGLLPLGSRPAASRQPPRHRSSIEVGRLAAHPGQRRAIANKFLADPAAFDLAPGGASRRTVALKTIARYVDAKKPKTLAEAEHMLDLISVMADETILDEDAAESSLAKGLISNPFFP